MLNGMGEGENQGILNACHKLNYFSRQNPNPEVLKKIIFNIIITHLYVKIEYVYNWYVLNTITNL